MDGHGRDEVARCPAYLPDHEWLWAGTVSYHLCISSAPVHNQHRQGSILIIQSFCECLSAQEHRELMDEINAVCVPSDLLGRGW